MALGDRIQLQQVLLTLVMDGLEAMASVTDRPRKLIIRSAPDDDDHVRVAVQDTGIGIAANDLDHVFSAFFTTKPGGMGMGLSISRSIVEAHGGRLLGHPQPAARRRSERRSSRCGVPDEGRVDSPPPGSVPWQPRSLAGCDRRIG